uniref:BTB domain-containing protein n=1 Tax=Panagrellus redivivus TaxID=6233 RepID=A0A7E4USD6_PANRE
MSNHPEASPTIIRKFIASNTPDPDLVINAQAHMSSVQGYSGESTSNCVGSTVTTENGSEEVIRFNVGGSSYCCKTSTLKARLTDTKLSRFVCCTHEARLCLCDAYFEDTHQYYFERPPKLFDTIYKYYATGALHRPLDVCEVEFYMELAFWRIPESQISPCCWPRHQALSDSMEDLTINTKKRNSENGPIRERMYHFFEGDGSFGSTVFTAVSIGFVLISVLGLVLGSIHEFQVPIHKKGNVSKRVIVTEQNATMPGIIWEPHPFFNHLETVCIIWFTIEYLLRFLVAPKRVSFIFEILNIVDAIAIIPFYLEGFLAVVGIDSTSLSDIKGAFLVVRILRVLRVVRILKLGRYSSGMRTFALTLRSSARQLGMMGMVLCTGVIFFSTLIYYVEKDEHKTPFTSIPAAFWFVLVTMTTVGYGDTVPVTTFGKLIASGAIVSGVLVLALPITIIVDNFMKVSGNHQQSFPAMSAFPGPGAGTATTLSQSSHPNSPSSKKPLTASSFA